MKRRPLVFWVLLVGAIAATVWWAQYVPRPAQAPLRAIPANATWLSLHENLAARWSDLAANPLLVSVAGAMGADPEEWRAQAASQETRQFLNLLARDTVCIAYVPEMRITGRPAWVFSAWLGGRSQRLRWLLKSRKEPTLRRAASRNGWSVWVWTPKGMKGGERITFALVEGMLVGCIAADTLGIEDVLACYDGHLPSLARTSSPTDDPTTGAVDRGWIRMLEGQGYGPRLYYTLDIKPNGALAGVVLTPHAPSLATPTPAATSADEFSRLMRDHPAAALVIDRALARAWLRTTFTNVVGREVATLLGGEDSGLAALALVGGRYSGRFMAVRLPSLLAAYSTPNPTQSMNQIREAFDRLNAVTPWGLVPQPVQVGTQRVYAIESTGQSAYAALEPAERLAYVPLNQSLVFSSNLETLTKLLREAQQAPPNAPGVLARGVQRMRAQHALGYLWMNLEEGAKMLRIAVTAWSLKLLVENPAGSQPTRQRLNELKAWIDALAPQQTLQIWVRPRQQFLEYEFRLGHESEGVPGT